LYGTLMMSLRARWLHIMTPLNLLLIHRLVLLASNFVPTMVCEMRINNDNRHALMKLEFYVPIYLTFPVFCTITFLVLMITIYSQRHRCCSYL
jgi:hypothetical protein